MIKIIISKTSRVCISYFHFIISKIDYSSWSRIFEIYFVLDIRTNFHRQWRLFSAGGLSLFGLQRVRSAFLGFHSGLVQLQSLPFPFFQLEFVRFSFEVCSWLFCSCRWWPCPRSRVSVSSCWPWLLSCPATSTCCSCAPSSPTRAGSSSSPPPPPAGLSA